MDDVAERCGILKGSLYYHYDSKESMRDACLALELNRRLACSTGSWRAEGDPGGALLAVVAGHRAWVASDEYRGCFIVNAAVEFPGDRVIPAIARRYQEHAGGLLQKCTAPSASRSSAPSRPRSRLTP